MTRIKSIPVPLHSPSHVPKSTRHHGRRKQQRGSQLAPLLSNMTILLSSFLLMTIYPSSIQLVHGSICKQLKQETLSSLYQALSTKSKKTTLCPFTIEGKGCDVNTPFILDASFQKRSKYVKCDLNSLSLLGGVCKIHCSMDTHFVVRDGRKLILDSMILEGARKGSVHIERSDFQSISSIWRNNQNQSTDTSSNGGGAIRGDSRSSISVISSQFWNNYSKYHGGAIYSNGAAVYSAQSIYVENEATKGAAIYAEQGKTRYYVKIYTFSNIFASNRAKTGPVISLQQGTIWAPLWGQTDQACDNLDNMFPDGGCNGIFFENTKQCTIFPLVCTSPTASPTTSPTITLMPSSKPSDGPSASPSISSMPSNVPSAYPSIIPSAIPSISPTLVPSVYPSETPSELLSVSPSKVPSEYPSEVPSEYLSEIPSEYPSEIPSEIPTNKPNISPSAFPSLLPSVEHSENPSISGEPSEYHSSGPSSGPSQEPSSIPSSSSKPSSRPSRRPSRQPSSGPSQQPSSIPSLSSKPSSRPSRRPSSGPSQEHSSIPSSSSKPSSRPSQRPSQQPSSGPSQQPSSIPSSIPSSKPSSRPSQKPSQQPSRQPSKEPSNGPIASI